MDDYKHIEITAAEISTLWTSYQSDTLAVCGLTYFLSHVNDDQIRMIIEETLTLTKQRVEQLVDFFQQEDYPVPHGFTEQDVNVSAPRLFSDNLYLQYILNMTDVSMVAYTSSLVSAERKDVIEFYAKHLTIIKNLHKQAKELAKEKGILVRAPLIPRPKQIDFVKKQKFLAGWFAERRPLLGVEITNLIFNAKRNALGHAVITGFSQVAQSKEIRKYFERGRDIAFKHADVFSSILHDDDLTNSAILMTPEVTDSTVAPFSDRLMLELVTVLIASGMGQYGVGMASSPRHDLGAHYVRLSAEIAKYADDGATIAIDHGWMEQPPMAADRKDLAK
ncbi:hypothetical protein J2Z83_002577 [Virgibacillus natechei]|uniref:DUF3231 family protein n=1 Tax=Virgibacillus natechei TaxID=1216297 RepID=A0ABS4IHP8_9BACI|nr:DUF3231 family protein [Virgibacillus natechei]MBP1970456.1 hypothetical protein [Virgibacillus natechei]UZD13895.1 DUF3231 family protein [Virgibacillus natechei]